MTNEILNQFKVHPQKKRPLIVGIDGLSGAGKSTLVTQLERELKNKCIVSVIHIDDHIVESSKRYHTGYDEWYEYYYLQWNIEMITNDLFKKIHNRDKELTLPFYNKSTDTNTFKKIKITPESIILIEGIFLLRKEWKKFYDYTLFLDCPREIRYERVLKRELVTGDSEERLNKYKKRYWLGEDYYLKTQHPRKEASKIYNSFL
ncbi:uridine kinase [Cytobacillus purgationiresistens]|uniref:Uridine kinase n=2 Tax=Cytobacillus purgationiresistens TaxID=863449 RepID=A0ABU0ANQ8_9BACI|nr:uridine kinase [Cytobacillus purgationiresistens]